MKRSKLLPEGGQFSLSELTPFVNRLRAAVVFSKQVAEVARDDETREAWREVYTDLSEARPGMFGAVTARSEAHVLRLSMLYALLDSSAVIRQEHLLAALALWEYAESSARFIFGDALGNPVADEILRALKNNPEGLTRTDIRNLFQRNKSAGAISQALSLLVEHGLAYSKKGETSEAGGRPSERWFARRPARVSTT